MKLNLIITFLILILSKNLYASGKYDSARFTDDKFSNTSESPKFGLWDVISMRFNTEWASWPDWVTKKQAQIVTDKVYGNNIHVTFINHATFLIQSQSLNILTDPIFSKRCSPVSFAGPARVHTPGIAMKKLPKIDLIIISHDHYDHLDTDTLDFLIERDNPKIYVGRRVGSRIPKSQNIVELDWWQSHRYNEQLVVNFVEVQHFSGRGIFDRFSTLWGGYVLELDGKKIFFAGDTGYSDHFERIKEKYGSMDISFIPIGAYEPRYFMKFYHMNPKESVRAHNDLQSKLSIGMHFGTFQLTAEKINDPIEQLEIQKKKQFVPDNDFITLEVGVVTQFSWQKGVYQLSN